MALTEYNLYGLIKIKTNIKEIQDFLFAFKNRDFGAKENREAIITVESKNRLEINKRGFKRIGDFYYNAQGDILYCEQAFFAPAQLLVKGLSSRYVLIQATPTFIKLPTILRGGINFIYLFREIMLLKLVERGCILLHSACVDIDGSGMVFSAFPNSGKTYLSFALVKHGYGRLLSDEYGLVNDKLQIKSFWSMSALGPKVIKDFKIRISQKEFLRLIFCRLRALALPFLFEPNIWVHSTRIFSEQERKAESLLKYIVFLERGNNEIINIDREEAFKKLLLLAENEFSFSSNYFLQVYSYANKNFDLFGFQQQQRQLIRNIIRGANDISILRFTPSSIEYLYAMISTYLKNLPHED